MEKIKLRYKQLVKNIKFIWFRIKLWKELYFYRRVKINVMKLSKHYIEVNLFNAPLDILIESIGDIDKETTPSDVVNIIRNYNNSKKHMRYYSDVFISSNSEYFLNNQSVWEYIVSEYGRLKIMREETTKGVLDADELYKMRILSPVILEIEELLTNIRKIEQV